MIRIVTDTTADLWQSYVSERHIAVLDMIFSMSEKDYLATPDTAAPMYMAPDEFYRRMRSGEVARTTQINQIQYEEVFEKILAAGDDILYAAFSSGLTGSQNNARLAWEELAPRYPDRSFRMIDTKSASMGEGLVVYMITEHFAANPGLSLDELADYTQDMSTRVHHWFTVDDLKYLKRSGRVSGPAALIGTVLSIKPVLHVDAEGHLVAVEKVQGRKKALRRLAEQMEATCADPKNGTVFIGHCDCLEDAHFLEDILEQKFGRRANQINGITPIIGCHSGPGTVALFYVSNDKR